MAKDLKDKIKREIKNFKEKRESVVGDPKITGVTRPKDKKKVDPKESNKRKRKEAEENRTLVGPRGGRYEESKTGHKRYKKKSDKVKKALIDIIEDSNKVANFITKFKGDRNG